MAWWLSRMWLVDVIVVALLLTAVADGLSCWKCVGPDCGGEVSSSEFAEAQQCEKGAVCQKSEYEYFDMYMNKTVTTVPIRSCSFDTGCEQVTDTSDCKNYALEYQGYGCAKRYCCDTDMCNGGDIIVITSGYRTIAIAVLYIFAIHLLHSVN